MKGIYAIPILIILYGCSMKSSMSKGNPESKLPNVVIFYVDDLGYADLSAYGAKGVSTPNVDALANKGQLFTDAHSSAATCTPSRYSLLTGEYAFRRNAAILPGDAPLLIDTSKMTLPKLFRKAGYTSAVVGKWHLGLGNGSVDWNQHVSPGPLEIGFDYSFLLPATGDRVPTVFLENHDVVNLVNSNPLNVSYKKDLGQIHATKENSRYESDEQHSQTLINGVGRIGSMTGGEEAYWTDEEFPFLFTEKAVKFIDQNKNNPFFLFFSFHDIHVPRLPHEQFKGKSKMGPRGDAIVQMDWMTGQIVNKLKELGLEENTLILFTSDNGPVLDDGYADFAIEMLGDHEPSGPFRGGKYSAFEAGTRVPTIAYWPGTILSGVNEALISQVDIIASIAKLVNVPLQEGQAIDSEDMLDEFLGNSKEGREYMLSESFVFSLRKENWKYIHPISENKKFPKWLDNKGVETGFSHESQLFDLDKDIHEEVNLAKEYPEIVQEMESELKSIMKDF